MSNNEVATYMNRLGEIYDSIRKENMLRFSVVTLMPGPLHSGKVIRKITKGAYLMILLTSNCLEQLICEPTHIQDDGSQSCMDLICTDQSFTFLETVVLPSMDPQSKHNIIHGTTSINIPRPPPYRRKIWDYKSAETTHICDELLKVNWQDLFFNLKSSGMGLLFTDVFLHIMTEHVSNKIITCNDKDAPWITPR